MQILPKYKYYFALSDILVVIAALVISVFIAELDHLIELTFNNLTDWLIITGALVFLFFVVFDLNNLYKDYTIVEKSMHFKAVLKSLLIGITIVAVITMFMGFSIINKFFIPVIVFLIFTTLLFYFIRVKLLSFLYQNYFVKNLDLNILVFGNGRDVERINKNKRKLGLNIFEYNIDINGEKNIPENELSKIVNDISHFVINYRIKEIFITFDNISYCNFFNLMDKLKHLDSINIKVSTNLTRLLNGQAEKIHYGNIPVADFSLKKYNKTNKYLKRILDIVASSIIIITHAPIMGMIALIIKITSPGPVLFKQKRIGLNGKPFTFYKFRSMTVEDEDDEVRKNEMLKFMKNKNGSEGNKVINERRVTSIGRLLRRTSIDELPQMFNVLKGEMSLVGPRPCLPYEFENFEEWHKKRTTVIPGCTGIWQVSGRSEVTFDESVLMDIYYIFNSSFALDLKLIFKTIPVMVFGRGGK